MPHTNIDLKTRRHARSRRRYRRDAERMWWILPTMKPKGMGFRRQAPTGPYGADFVRHAGRIIVESNSSQHADLRCRMSWLVSQGYQVRRLRYVDLLKSAQSGEAILAALNERNVGATENFSPLPLHQEEEFAAAQAQGFTP